MRACNLACKKRCYAISFCVPALLARERLRHPSVPHPGREASGVSNMRPRIMQPAVRRKASDTDTLLHNPSSPVGSSLRGLACQFKCYDMSICVPAVRTRHRLSTPPLHPTAPRPGVARRKCQRVLRPRIMQPVITSMPVFSLPRAGFHYLSELPDSSIQGLACKM
jgi:hypothetical protein